MERPAGVVDLPDEAVAAVLRHCDEAALLAARAAGSRLRRHVDDELRARLEREHGVAVAGAPPPTPLAYLRPRFARLRRLDAAAAAGGGGARASLARLAIEYNLTVVQIKRANNVASDAALACRAVVVLPADAPAPGDTVEYFFDGAAAMAGSAGAAPGRRHSWWVLIDDGGGPAAPAEEPAAARARLEARQAALLAAACGVDAATAAFYLRGAGADVRRAAAALHADAAWAHAPPGGGPARRRRRRCCGLALF